MSVASAAPSTFADDALAGHNRISTQALTSVTQAAAAENFGVQAAEVRVSFSDDAGRLAISLATPVAVPSLTDLVSKRSPAISVDRSIWARTIAAKKLVLDKVSYLTGSDISKVDIRITGVRLVSEGGVP